MAKRRNYTEEELQAAVSAVKQSRLTCSEAARDFHIPRKNIADSVTGRYKKHAPGPATMLTFEEEQSLVEYIKYMQRQGFPMTRQIVRQHVVAICQKDERKTLFNLEKGPSDKWFRKFLTKHPCLTERSAERQDRSRARMSNETTVNNYFTLLKNTVQKLGLENKPGQIFNCDETGFSGKEKPREKVMGQKGQHFYQQALFSNTHVTLHMCIAADGKVLPSFVIFEKSFPHTAYKDGVPGNWMFAYSDSGYMDSNLFYTWFKDLFIPNCGKERPVLLVMDNHDSHINLDIIKVARENSIDLIGLPPHTTHFLQPLDVAINGPLKAKLNTLALSLGYVNKHQTVNKAKFPTLLSYAIDQFCSPANVKNAFRKSGLFPINPMAIDRSQILQASFSKATATTPSAMPDDNAHGLSISEEASLPASLNTLQSQSEPSDPNASVAPSQTCDKCGSYLSGNPLVKEGLVPSALSDIFLPVPSKPQSVKRKTITDARVITSDDFYKSLVNRAEELEKRNAEIAKRKLEREEKRKSKEGLSKKKGNNGKKEKTEPKHIPYSTCETCGEIDPPNDTQSDILWICCDTCNKWHHQHCVGLQDEEDVDEVFFICTTCSGQAV